MLVLSFERLHKIFFLVYLCTLCTKTADDRINTIINLLSFGAILLIEMFSVYCRTQIRNYKLLFWYLLLTLYIVISSAWAIKGYPALTRPFLFSSLQIIAIIYILNNRIKSIEIAEEYLSLFLASLLYFFCYLIIIVPFRMWGTTRLDVYLGINSNTIGILSLFAFMITVYYYRKNKIYALLTIPFVFLIIMSGSRKAIIMLAISLMIYYVCNEKGWKATRNLIIIVVMVLIVFYSIMHIEALYNIIGYRIEKMLDQFSGGKGDRSIRERDFFRQYAVKMFLEKPLIGWGANGFETQMKIIHYELVAYSHCNYLELLSTGGIVGFGLYYCVPFSVAIQLIARINRFHNNRDVFLLSIIMSNIIAEYYYVSYFEVYNQLFLSLLYIMFYKSTYSNNKLDRFNNLLFRIVTS